MLAGHDLALLDSIPNLPYKTGATITLSIKNRDDKETKRLVRALPEDIRIHLKGLSCYLSQKDAATTPSLLTHPALFKSLDEESAAELSRSGQ
jgi:hypothetical protein